MNKKSILYKIELKQKAFECLRALEYLTPFVCFQN